MSRYIAVLLEIHLIVGDPPLRQRYLVDEDRQQIQIHATTTRHEVGPRRAAQRTAHPFEANLQTLSMLYAERMA